jgi:hypothetical protein
MPDVDIAGRGGVIGPQGNPVNPDGHQADKIRSFMKGRVRMKTNPLLKSQIESLKGGEPCWIYNISPHFIWHRHYKGLGKITIPKAPIEGSVIAAVGEKDAKGNQLYRRATAADIASGKYRLSAPVVISASYVNSFDKGDLRRVPYIEYGYQIAESIIGNSKEFPIGLGDPTANLANWGVFYTKGVPFEKLSAAEQDRLLSEAEAVHQVRCWEKIQKADEMFHTTPRGILKIHRDCAKYLGEEKPWCTARPIKKVSGATIPCPLCTSDILETSVVCKNCHGVVDADRYAEQQERLEQAKTKAAEKRATKPERKPEQQG